MGVAICDFASELSISSEALEKLLFRPMLSRYPLSERRAIVCHALYVGCRFDGDVELAEVIRSWESGAGAPWRREKMRRDCQEQLQRIARHRELLEKQAGRAVTPDEAARDWIEKHAADWRDWWEQQPESSPVVFLASLEAIDPSRCAPTRPTPLDSPSSAR